MSRHSSRHYTLVERACKKLIQIFAPIYFKNVNVKPQLEEVSFCRNFLVLCICDICVDNNNCVLYLDLTFINAWHHCQTIHKLMYVMCIDYVCQLKEISWNLLSLCPVISISFLWNKILKTLELYFRTTSWFELIIILSSLSWREMEQFQRIENWNYFLFPRTVEDLDVVRDYNILIPIFYYNPFIPLSILILAVKHWTKGGAVLDTLCKIMVLHTCTHYLI